ncbi:MAG: hypothetical protein L6455_05055 [Kiritimatiellae bacterium]|nr:hypothetical protein [Verrucomicrobiota bacterium]MBU4291735.1 hypothetical protein [Verrucomicrobiota bacterium]MCG2679325.1 hypothetical protein [Kiritimatiellia bacterium]
MKRLLIGMMVLGFVASLTAMAEEKDATTDADKPVAEKTVKAKAKSSAAEITVTGKISKEEAKKVGNITKFILTTSNGDQIKLPETKAEVADLEKLVGKDVKVVGTGKEVGKKDDKKIHLKSITSVEEVAAPAVK